MKEHSTKWLSIEEAAAHLGMGKTVLYNLARNGGIPARKIGKKWAFDKKSLDAWMNAKRPLEEFFIDLDVDIEGNNRVREPQCDGYLRAYDFFRSGKNKAILQIPVGCGKTGLCSLLPLGLAKGRVLIIAPNLTIKKGLYDAMDITNKQKCFWLKSSVLKPEQLVAGPWACTLDSGNISTAEKSHIVITNIQQLATNVDKWLSQFTDTFFDMIIVDEAHHSAAASWQKVIDRFPSAKVVLLTATPFRSDRRELDGELVYRYSFRSAALKGYIKRLKASYVAPEKIELGFTDKKGNAYSLKEVMKLKEETWFSRGVALARVCNQHIVDSSLQKLEELRQSGTQHQLIAVACSINHGRDIRSLYQERGYTAKIIHSKQSEEEKNSVLTDLRNGTLDCIIQVQMLGEGFDHPKLSVAAIFRPFRSLAPYIQFVGRIMRVIVQNNPSHPDNMGQIVTHLGLNQDKQLESFKDFENDDYKFWENVVGGKEPEVPPEVKEGNARLRAGDQVVVHNEIIDGLWEEDFICHEDQEIIDDLRERFALLGLDPSEVATMVKQTMQKGMKKNDPTAPFPVQPQMEWEEARRRLNEEAKRLAKILLNHLDINMQGRELIKYGLENGKNNYICALMLVNKAINKELGKERGEATIDEFRMILDNREDLLQQLVRRVRKVKSDYEQANS